MSRAADTSSEIENVRSSRLAAMSGQERMAAFWQLMDTARALAEAGVRHRHPDADDEEVKLRLAVAAHGPELVREVYGWVPGE